MPPYRETERRYPLHANDSRQILPNLVFVSVRVFLSVHHTRQYQQHIKQHAFAVGAAARAFTTTCVHKYEYKKTCWIYFIKSQFDSFVELVVLNPAVPPNDQIHDTYVENRNCIEDMCDVQKRIVVDDMIVNWEYDKRIYK